MPRFALFATGGNDWSTKRIGNVKTEGIAFSSRLRLRLRSHLTDVSDARLFICKRDRKGERKKQKRIQSIDRAVHMYDGLVRFAFRFCVCLALVVVLCVGCMDKSTPIFSNPLSFLIKSPSPLSLLFDVPFV